MWSKCMNTRICIIGSGPTGIFTLKTLVASPVPLIISVFDAELVAGKGTPYLPGANDPVMLSNIPSIEIPPLMETLVDWLNRQSNDYLSTFNINRSSINDREFYPRLVVGDYFHDQFQAILSVGKINRHRVEVYPGHRVTDIELGTTDIRVKVSSFDGDFDAVFDHVVMATGHNWPENTQVKPGYFASPWPATELQEIGDGRLGILGTSLSGIDALLTVATSCGSFVCDDGGTLQYVTSAGHQDFHATMMSRKGLLPEADFYCPLPYIEPQICTYESIQNEVNIGSQGLLDRVFDLFQRELLAADPDYSAEIGLSHLSVDTFADAYYGRRSDTDPFVWAAANLAEAHLNFELQFTIPWRYAILITHEIIEKAIPHLDTTDLTRFNRSFKGIFIDQYATVPHLSIRRLLALRNAGRLDIIKLGSDYDIETEGLERGARIRTGDREQQFSSFIDATGQSSLSVRELPFPTLLKQRGIQAANTPEPARRFMDGESANFKKTGGIEIDEAYRPRGATALSNRLYCVAIPFLLHKRPFVQGITSAAELGKTAANAILADIAVDQPPILRMA
jgi:uncharacterized NAD(P)/FAD-binding protein YdhS